MTGTNRVQPAQPDLMGKDLIDLQDSDGLYLIREILEKADDGGAWADYRFLDPATGREERKRSWVVTHDAYVFRAGTYS